MEILEWSFDAFRRHEEVTTTLVAAALRQPSVMVHSILKRSMVRCLKFFHQACLVLPSLTFYYSGERLCMQACAAGGGLWDHEGKCRRCIKRKIWY